VIRRSTVAAGLSWGFEWSHGIRPLHIVVRCVLPGAIYKRIMQMCVIYTYDSYVYMCILIHIYIYIRLLLRVCVMRV
jgi:hypothetical protein